MGSRQPVNLPRSAPFGRPDPKSQNFALRPAIINPPKPQVTNDSGPNNAVKNVRNMFENPPVANKPIVGGPKPSFLNNKPLGTPVQNSVSKIMTDSAFQSQIAASPQQQRRLPPPAPKKSPSPEPEPAPQYPKFKALFDYEPVDSDELAFYKGEILEVLEQHENGWWDARIGDREGFVPHNYIEPCN